MPTEQKTLFGRIDVHRNLRRYNEGGAKDMGRHPDGRYASFDYCFNYFQTFREQNRIADICTAENIERSCFQLAFYLASWGMLRGSSFLLWKSIRFYRCLIEMIARSDERLWGMDVDRYLDDDSIALLLRTRSDICAALGRKGDKMDTLATKIMLGVYGNVPAYDQYFCKGLEVSTFGKKSLRKVAEFYAYHRDVIDDHARATCTLDFHSGKPTQRHYTKAKIVDMVLVMQGQ
jgi:hypothetical protein